MEASGENNLHESRRSADAASLARLQRLLDKQGQIRRWRVEILHGSAGNVRFDSAGVRVDLQLAGRSVRLTVADGNHGISENDSLFICARRADPFSAVIYFNESTGSSSIDTVNWQGRLMLKGGATGTVAGLAILLTTLFAARAETTFAFPGWLQIPVYAACVVVAAALIFLSGGILIVGLQTLRLSNLMRFIAFGR